jgi:hypothetical protein
MADILDSFNATWFLPALLLVLLVAWLIYRRRAGGSHLQRVLRRSPTRESRGSSFLIPTKGRSRSITSC